MPKARARRDLLPAIFTAWRVVSGLCGRSVACCGGCFFMLPFRLLVRVLYRNKKAKEKQTQRKNDVMIQPMPKRSASQQRQAGVSQPG